MCPDPIEIVLTNGRSVRGLPDHLPWQEQIPKVDAKDTICPECAASKALIGYETVKFLIMYRVTFQRTRKTIPEHRIQCDFNLKRCSLPDGCVYALFITILLHVVHAANPESKINELSVFDPDVFPI